MYVWQKSKTAKREKTDSCFKIFFFYSLTKVEKTRKIMYVTDEGAETLFSFTPGKQVSWYHLLT